MTIKCWLCCDILEVEPNARVVYCSKCEMDMDVETRRPVVSPPPSFRSISLEQSLSKVRLEIAEADFSVEELEALIVEEEAGKDRITLKRELRDMIREKTIYHAS